MSSFINFNNKEVTTEVSYTAEAVKIALLKSETKSSIKAETLTKNIKEPLSLNEALVFFTDKLSAMKSLSLANAEINEGKIKQFEADYKDMESNIKKGIGWIDPEYVGDTWENSSDSIDFELVETELYKRLIAAGLLAFSNPEDGETKGVPVRSLKDLNIKESLESNKVNETLFFAFFNNKKIEVEGKDLWDAKQKAIIELKVPKSKIGYLAVVSAESQKNQDFKFESKEIVEAYGKPAGLTLADTKKVAELYANALSKADGVKATVNKKSLEEDSFDLDVDGEEYAGGSYNIYHSGEVVNHAVPGSPSYGYFDDKLDTIVKNIKNPKLHENVTPESIVTEGAMSDIDIIAQEAKNFKEFVKEFKKEYKNMDAGNPKELEAWLQSVYDSAKESMGESVVTEGFISEIDILAQESKNFKEFLKAFKTDNRYKGLDTVGDVKEFEAWLQSVYDSAKENMDESKINEGQFSWMTQDTGNQIGSEKQNTIAVTMFDDKGNKWEERSYDGYGEFGGKDYYELLAQMNGIENADRQDGIDIAFDKKKVKGKVLFPALVEDPKRFNFKKHDFTQEAENDPNQSWYQEEEYDDDYDEYDESVVTEAKDNALQDYVDNMSQKTFKGGGNGQNLLDNAMELAGHIDDYRMGRDTRGYEEDGFYGPTTVTLFKRLVDSMSADDIKNNQADKYESKVNEHNFKVGDRVKMSHGGSGVIKSLDKESGADDEKYYNVELPSGEIHKHAPNELTKESVVNEGRSINKIQKEWSETTTKMQQKAGEWKVAEGDRKSELLDEMKALTAKKRQLEAELDAAVAGKDKDLELVVSEGNAFGAARAKAIADGAKEFEFEGETYKVEDVGPDDKENAKEFVEESKLTLDALVEMFQVNVNEDLRSDVKKFIKDNASELNTLADNDEWDLMYAKLYSEFNVEANSTKGKDLLKTFQFVF